MTVVPRPSSEWMRTLSARLLGEARRSSTGRGRCLAEWFGGEERVERLRNHSGGMPVPVSDTLSDRYSPRACPAARRPRIDPAVGGLDGDPTPVRHGVPGVDAEVSSAFSNGTGRPTRPQVRRFERLDLHAGSDRAPKRSSMPSTRAFTSVPFGARVCRRVRTPAGGGSWRRPARFVAPGRRPCTCRCP